MMLEIVWHPAALYQLMQLHWRVASNIDADIIKFGETRAGELECVPPQFVLHSGVFRVRFELLHDAPVMHVLRIYRSRRESA